MKSKSKDVQSACITECRIATNCPQGGDSGHGGRTVFELTNLGGTDLSVSLDDDNGNYREFNDVTTVRIRLGGDCEAENLCRLLRWAANELENMMDENSDEYAKRLNVKDPFAPNEDSSS
jgi:hypothetical protein